MLKLETPNVVMEAGHAHTHTHTNRGTHACAVAPIVIRCYRCRRFVVRTARARNEPAWDDDVRRATDGDAVFKTHEAHTT